MAGAQGVPVADGKSIVQHDLETAQMTYLTGARELEAVKLSQTWTVAPSLYPALPLPHVLAGRFEERLRCKSRDLAEGPAKLSTFVLA